jgi:hypothetical protein
MDVSDEFDASIFRKINTYTMKMEMAVHPKYSCIPIKIQCVTSQEAAISIFTAVRTSYSMQDTDCN